MTATATATTLPLARAFVADPDHSTFAFAVRHMGISVFRGSFEDVAAELRVRAGALVLDGSATVESLSVRRPAALREHLLGPEFFDAARHPVVAFRSRDVVLGEDGTARVDGELTIRNVTTWVTARGTWQPAVEDPYGGVRAAIELTTAIDRRDYGMTWNMPLPKGGDALANEVTLSVHLELLQQEA
jgi:polyisoprenoid-binding protein YceI